jgi:hypothetical protein
MERSPFGFALRVLRLADTDAGRLPRLRASPRGLVYETSRNYYKRPECQTTCKILDRRDAHARRRCGTFGDGGSAALQAKRRATALSFPWPVAPHSSLRSSRLERWKLSAVSALKEVQEMKKIVAIMALVLGVFFFGGSAAAQPAADAGLVNESACEQTDPLWADVPPPAQLGVPHVQGHRHQGTGEVLGCHHAIGTEDPNPNP